MKKKFVYIIVSVGICLLMGFLSGLATEGSIERWNHNLGQFGYQLPTWTFTPVWVVLYILTGIAAGLVWAKGFYHLWVKTALYHFVFQLLLNVLWCVVFFGFQDPFWGLLIIISWVILVGITIKWFKIVSNTAAYLLIPYFVWVCWAGYLNFKIWEIL